MSVRNSLGSTGMSWVLPSSCVMPRGRAESGTLGAKTNAQIYTYLDIQQIYT